MQQLTKPGRWRKQRKDGFDLFFNSNKNKNIMSIIRYLFPNKTIPKAQWETGSNWFTITLKDSKIMMNMLFKRFDIIDTLEYVLCADEIIFHTLIAEAKINITNDYHRYIDWRTRESHPIVFTNMHIKDILKRKCDFWARKFVFNKSDEVLNFIDERINKFNCKKFQKKCFV